MQSRGIDYGQTIARLAIEQFPDGFDDEAGDRMQKIVKTAITSALDKLAAGGVRQSLREAHEGGFYAGVALPLSLMPTPAVLVSSGVWQSAACSERTPSDCQPVRMTNRTELLDY